jgi:hypothetical protein
MGSVLTQLAGNQTLISKRRWRRKVVNQATKVVRMKSTSKLLLGTNLKIRDQKLKKRTKPGLFGTQLPVVAIVGLALSLRLTASAAITLDVVASSAPNVFGSPSWAGYTANALNSLQNGLGNIGSRATDPTAYEIAGPTIQPGDVMVTSFNSWMGVAGPLASPFNRELGNRIHFGLHAYGSTQFRLQDLTFSMSSSDSGNTLGFAGDFLGFDYNGTTRFGVDWVDGIRGNGNDIVYTSGNGATLVNELVYVGVGNAFWPGYGDPYGPDPANPIGGAQAAMDDTVNYILANAPFTITGSYSILENSGSDSVTVVPEPTTVIAGALLLLPFGMSTLRLLRKQRSA